MAKNGVSSFSLTTNVKRKAQEAGREALWA